MIAFPTIDTASAADYADCEADLARLEAVMNTPGHSTRHLAPRKNARASEAMRKIDNKIYNQIVMNALKATDGRAVANVVPTTFSASLGELKPIRIVTNDASRTVQKGDLVAAKIRIKDLETAWDNARTDLQAKNPGAWDVLDKSINPSLKQLRASKPDVKGSAGVLAALLAQIDMAKRHPVVVRPAFPRATITSDRTES